jgi:hypothetical protein
VVAPVFAEPVTLSDPAYNAFVPVVAAHPGHAIVVWHEFPPGQGARIAYSLVENGIAGPAAALAEPFSGAKQPSVAATSQGYVLTYSANDGMMDVIRAVRLDIDGAILDGPVTISAPGAVGAMPRVAAAGDEEAFAWTDGSAHHFARRGSLETLEATPVGTSLQSGGILNFPRVALTPDGTSYLAYRDGGADTIDWEVLLVTRPAGQSFGLPANVSKSPGLLSDDISLALEVDGTLDIAWVDQDGEDVTTFEVEYAARSPDGEVTAPARYGEQGLWTWKPAVVRGLASVWYTGTLSGPMYFGAPGLAPTPILPAENVGHVAMALGEEGTYHLAFAAKQASVSVVRYSPGSPP